ncbi:uncharacterized protein I303_103265 [Kwoniella dejecticola CBS 10117]|uniref:Zn(2)-C6 fungal-type domain-containing protein n=1 Tax=Kwoniella dejecticola CBS 10117 TaxID=1296121 RepID=A0AAJ8KMC4_9TREE
MHQGSSSPSSIPSAPAKRAKPNHGTRHRCINACNRCKLKKLKCYRVDEDSSKCAACSKALESCVFEDTVMRPGYNKYIIALENRCAKLEKALAELCPDHPDLTDHYSSVGTSQPLGASKSGERAVSRDETSQFSEENVDRNALNSSHTALSGLLQSHAATPSRAPILPHVIDLSSVMQPTSSTSVPANPYPSIPSLPVAEKILHTVYLHLQCRYPFLDWDQIHLWHSNRDSYLNVDVKADYKDQVAGFFLWMIYAIGVQLDPIAGLDSAQSYFERASRYSNTVTHPHDLTTVQALLLITFYAFRAPAGPSLWLYGGLSMRLCVELDLYRSRTPKYPSIEDEWKKRVFWSAYTFDRLISHACSRPVSLADEAIDVEMPLDICASITDPSAIAAASAVSPSAIQHQLTNMSSAIVSIKMYRIRSRIHAAMPALRHPSSARELTVGFLTELEEWRRKIPTITPSTDIPMQAEDRLRWRYFLCVLLVLRPSVLSASPSDPTLSLCATAAAEACELDRTVHKGPSTRQTTISVCHTLLCGTTLLYCLYISPAVISQRVSSRAIRACSGTLAVYSQLFDQARPFYDIFEFMADEILSGGPEQGESQRRVIEVIAAMFNGNFVPLSSLYDQLRSKKAGECVDPTATQATSSGVQYMPEEHFPVPIPMPEQPTPPAAPPSTGLTPFLTATSGSELGQISTAVASADDPAGLAPDNLDIDWLNLDHALWEYMT